MPEHVRALLAILIVVTPVFLFAYKPICAESTAPADYRRRRNMWYGITVVCFLANSFWIYAFGMVALVWWEARRESNPVALYALLVLALPAYNQAIPGVGSINYLIELNHVRLLNIAILLPLALQHLKNKKPLRSSRSTDTLVLIYLSYLLLRQVLVDSPTGSIRTAIYLLSDYLIPYFAISRGIQSVRDFREVVPAFVLGVAALAAVSGIEFLRGWLLYDGLRGALGIDDGGGTSYLYRGEGGPLRALATTGHSIVLGYVMGAAMALFIYVQSMFRPRWMALPAAALIGVGLIAPLSRGPWVGCALAVLTALSFGPRALKRIALTFLVGGLALGVLLISPASDAVISHLPFVGDVDAGNVTYRQRLVEVSMIVFWQHPLLGALDYIANPALEEMRQGQGIIDMVNSYLAVALGYGLLGLALYLGPIITAAWSVVRTFLAWSRSSRDADYLGRALIGTLVGILVTIATVSSISVVPTVMWMVIAFCVAYGRVFEQAASQVRDAGRQAQQPVFRDPVMVER